MTVTHQWSTPAVLALLSLCGCGSTATVNSANVATTTIYQVYSGTFDAASKALSLSAQFRVGGAYGTTVRLSGKSAVAIDGQAMQLVDGDKAQLNLEGTLYEATTTTTAPAPSYTFHWAQDNGAASDNVLAMASPVTVSSPLAAATVSRGADLTVACAGNPVANAERITFELQTTAPSPGGQTPGPAADCTTTFGESCAITAAMMATLPAGPAQLTVSRWSSNVGAAVSGGSGAGTLTSTYRAAPIAITIGN